MSFFTWFFHLMRGDTVSLEVSGDIFFGRGRFFHATPARIYTALHRRVSRQLQCCRLCWSSAGICAGDCGINHKDHVNEYTIPTALDKAPDMKELGTI